MTDLTDIRSHLVASRTLMRSIISTLQRITLDGDPLQFLVEATTYQPFISLFHQIDAIEKDPSLQAIPDYASAIAIELRRGELPDKRDFLRFKFRNGTVDDDFRLLHAFNHKEDIPLTEFIYRIEVRLMRVYQANHRSLHDILILITFPHRTQ